MAEIQPLHAIHYDARTAGAVENLVAPPYDVIDDTMRSELVGKSPFNIVEVDLPNPTEGEDPYAHAEHLFEAWLQQGVLTKDRESSIWIMRQQFYLGERGSDPLRQTLNRTGFFARVRVEDYGHGRIRPHERTHPGPKEDRLRLTRATRANLSPIFSLFDDPQDSVWSVLEPVTQGEAYETVVDADGAADRIWRTSDPDIISDLQAALADRELLIADGHHRYETARVYAEEIGGEGDHNYVLMFLCAMEDPGIVILPTHRLLTDLKTPEKQEGIANALREHFDIERVALENIEPPAGELPAFGYIDAHFKQPFRLTLKDPKSLEQAMPDKPDAYRRLDTAALEALILRGPAGLSEDDISHLNGLAYARDTEDALDAVNSGRADAAFILRGTPIDQVRKVVAAGETMPPKSTFFYPKVPTGLIINPLE
ncbi:MAG TPA: DUF1015 domain-containing protein [Thermoleophilaceae bacterium]|jgi:uncharacterized protein (DUF1015 family)|nr:DUF1015 domain-containing protein [Thermoleophilaceae bacterium]